MKAKNVLKFNLFSLALGLGVFYFFFPAISAAAYNGLGVGSSTLILGAGENLFSGNINSASNAASNFLLVQKNSTSSLFKVGSDGGGFFLGNVGIGTVSPTASLQVNGGIYVFGGTGDVDNNCSSFPCATAGNATDQLLAASYINGTGLLTPGQYVRADVNRDGRVDMLDVELMDRLFIHQEPLEQVKITGRRIVDSNFFIDYYGNVGIGYGTSSPPAQKLAIKSGGTSYALDLGGAKMGNLGPATEASDLARLSDIQSQVNAAFLDPLPVTMNMGTYNIININKLTVATVDPLYNIFGTNYSTYGYAISGGVKEEYIGHLALDTYRAGRGYEGEINFSDLPLGSDLWVWRQAVDFSPDNIQVFLTPYGSFAKTQYAVEKDKIILHSNKPVSVAYRLVGKRFDWQNWPTKSQDQSEPASLFIN